MTSCEVIHHRHHHPFDLPERKYKRTQDAKRSAPCRRNSVSSSSKIRHYGIYSIRRSYDKSNNHCGHDLNTRDPPLSINTKTSTHRRSFLYEDEEKEIEQQHGSYAVEKEQKMDDCIHHQEGDLDENEGERRNERIFNLQQELYWLRKMMRKLKITNGNRRNGKRGLSSSSSFILNRRNKRLLKRALNQDISVSMFQSQDNMDYTPLNSVIIDEESQNVSFLCSTLYLTSPEINKNTKLECSGNISNKCGSKFLKLKVFKTKNQSKHVDITIPILIEDSKEQREINKNVGVEKKITVLDEEGNQQNFFLGAAVDRYENNDHREPLLAPAKDDFYVTKMTQWIPQIYIFYKQMIASFWTVEEIDLGGDIRDWNEKLTTQEKEFIQNILAFFLFADGLVIDNMIVNFMREIKIQCIVFTQMTQGFFETIHAETYATMFDTFITDADLKGNLENKYKTCEGFSRMKAWIEKYMNPKLPFAVRLLAFACWEGVFFSGAFCAMFWLKKRGLMQGLTFSNELISRDEGLHTDLACYLYSLLEYPLTYEQVKYIIEEAAFVAEEFINDLIPCRLIGMNADLMKQYICFVAKRLFKSLGHYKDMKAPFEDVKNPFDFMELISLQGKTNFFERRVGEYSKSGVMDNCYKTLSKSQNLNNSSNSSNNEDIDDNIFRTDADF